MHSHRRMHVHGKQQQLHVKEYVQHTHKLNSRNKSIHTHTYRWLHVHTYTHTHSAYTDFIHFALTSNTYGRLYCKQIHTHTLMHTHKRKERELEKDRETKRERERERTCSTKTHILDIYTPA